jgi:hypothetical protein
MARRDREIATRLHRTRPGVYRVGASPLTIHRYAEDGRVSWDIYGDTLEGRARIPGKWAFPRLSEARARAFEFLREQGYLP